MKAKCRLSCRDEHRTREWYRLRKRELCIRSSGWKINHKVVKFTPLHIAKELLDRAANQRPSPDDRLPFRDEELNGDQFHAVSLDRLNLSARTRLWRPCCAEHLREIWSRDICIKETNARAALRKGDREVDGHGTLPHSALA